MRNKKVKVSELQKMLEYAKITLLYSTDSREFFIKKREDKGCKANLLTKKPKTIVKGKQRNCCFRLAGLPY